MNITSLITLKGIIRSVHSGERENHEPQKSAQEISQKIQDLQKKIDQARCQVRNRFILIFSFLVRRTNLFVTWTVKYPS